MELFLRPTSAATEPFVGDVSVEARRDDLPSGGSVDWSGQWVAEFEAADGDLYWIVVDDGPPLLDPSCRDLVMTPDGPRSVIRGAWAARAQGAPLGDAPIVYEIHVKGFGGTYRGCIDHLDHVAAMGVSVIELMPVHPFDDTENYWGYMPLVWGAVHRGYADDGSRAAEELAELVGAAHDRGLHVWLDVVFNHTGEDGPAHPTLSLRGFDKAHLYRHHLDGRPFDDSGCGNDIDPGHPYVRHLVIEALDRLADLGVDGFRFDLASLLSRDGGGLVDLITEWGEGRGVALVAEPWDLGAYQVGHGWPWPSWWQWNDRFRDDVRGFLRGEPGLVHAIRQRVQGSPDLFGPHGDQRSLNFVTAHDGLTMHDLTTLTSDRHHSWDCGPVLRVQQIKNYFTLLLLAQGGAMWVMGDEFGRTQHNHDNPYDIDGPLTWVDWAAAGQWRELTEFVGALVGLRRRIQAGSVGELEAMRFYGIGPHIDEGFSSHSLAWCQGDFYVMVNAWWQPLTFTVQEPGEWDVELATAQPIIGPQGHALVPRSIVVLGRSG